MEGYDHVTMGYSRQAIYHHLLFPMEGGRDHKQGDVIINEKNDKNDKSWTYGWEGRGGVMEGHGHVTVFYFRHLGQISIYKEIIRCIYYNIFP